MSLTMLARQLLDTVLPPRCPGTGEIVDAPGTVSPGFWPQLTFIEAPMCGACGLPFSFENPEGTLCAACLETAPLFDAARSALVYNDASRKIIVGFKSADKLHSVDILAPWLRRAGHALLAECDVICPVPLHPLRLWQRRFNQSALLARALAGAAGKPCIPDLLVRRRHTPRQMGLNHSERAKNVRGAFAVRKPAAVAGKTVLLVDDVYTSGATLNECARVLKRAKAARILVLTAARVTREEFQ